VHAICRGIVHIVDAYLHHVTYFVIAYILVGVEYPDCTGYFITYLLTCQKNLSKFSITKIMILLSTTNLESSRHFAQ